MVAPRVNSFSSISIKLFHHLASLADFAHFDQVRRFKRQDVMPNPRGRLFHGPGEMRERGGRCHQQAQNVHAAGVR